MDIKDLKQVKPRVQHVKHEEHEEHIAKYKPSPFSQPKFNAYTYKTHLVLDSLSAIDNSKPKSPNKKCKARRVKALNDWVKKVRKIK